MKIEYGIINLVVIDIYMDRNSGYLHKCILKSMLYSNQGDKLI